MSGADGNPACFQGDEVQAELGVRRWRASWSPLVARLMDPLARELTG